MPVKFYKYHGLGNDYIVIDPRETALSLTPASIRLICDRNFGVGSDGILYGPEIEDGRIRLRIYNPDGSEAEKSGNGIRIFARYLFESGSVPEKRFPVDTKGGTIEIEILNDRADMVRVNMGACTFDSGAIPVAGTRREVVDEPIDIGGEFFRMTCVGIGNPHCVIPMDGLSRERALELGPAVERHALFPNRINMQLMRVTDRTAIRIEIWERGAGYTLASGSSSCAAACAARKLGLVDDAITVSMPGGELRIDAGDENNIYLTGAVAGVARGEFSREFIEAITRGDTRGSGRGPE